MTDTPSHYEPNRKLIGAVRLVLQKYDRERQAVADFNAVSAPGAGFNVGYCGVAAKALEFAESETNGAILLLTDELLDIADDVRKARDTQSASTVLAIALDLTAEQTDIIDKAS